MSTAVPVSTPPPSAEHPSDHPTPLVRMGDLYTHPAQMRTVYDPVAMAALTVQLLHAGGIAAWQPIVATPQPDGNGYFIVSGHRRRMALLLGWAFREEAAVPLDDESFTSDAVQAFFDSLLTQYPTIEAAAEALLPRYAEQLVPIHRFTGDLKEQILALQQANYGTDTPDPLGIAHSFHAALHAGVTERQIAHNAGQSVGYVRKHLALLRVPVALAQAIAHHTLPLSMAETVAEVQAEDAREGLSRFIVANMGQVTVEGVRACVALLKGWDQFRTPPMTIAHQGQRNMVRILATLWQRALSQDATNAWASAALLLYRNVNPHAPWESQSAYTEWVKGLGGASYHNEAEGILWEALVRDGLEEVSCATCPVQTLPPQLLARDLSDRSGVLGRPCRTPTRDYARRCINGFAPNDPLEVRVPFEWASHPGVTRQGSHYLVVGMDALEQAWLAQRAAEAVPDTPEPDRTGTPEVAEMPDPSPPDIGTSAVAPSEQQPAPPDAPGTTPPPSEPSPVQEMRDHIRDYMTRHTEMDWRHPFATPCATCQHHLTQSPTKDPTVPPCAWAARLRSVRFTQLVSDDGALTVPVCGQYASTWVWQDRIPVHGAKPPFPREYLLAQIRAHAKTRSGTPAFEFLTGRPMGPASYTDWFETQLAEAGGHLSDKQLFTLLVWSIAEHDRAERSTAFWLPADKHLSTFIPVREIPWR